MDKTRQLTKQPVKPVYGVTLFFLLVAALACEGLAPRPTAEPIYITATPQPKIDTPTPEQPVETAVLANTPDGSTPDETQVAARFPTLEPATPTDIPTQRATLTPSFTPTYTDTPTPRPTRGTPVKCGIAPEGSFGTIYNADPNLATQIGCPLGPAVVIQSAIQTFDNGYMIWASQYGDQQTRMIYAAYKNGTFARYTDTWTQGTDPETANANPPAGKQAPVRGFAKVWQNNAAVKSGLGWAVTGENGTPGQIQRFDRGEMILVATAGQIFVFNNGANTWRASNTP